MTEIEEQIYHYNDALAERFLDLYKKLERAVKDEYNLRPEESAIYYLANRRKEFAHYRNTLHICREVRNFLQHNQKIDGRYTVTPSIDLIKCLQTCIDRIEKPIRAIDVMVPVEKLLWRNPKDNVSEALRAMLEANFECIPILTDNKVAGVFTGNTLVQLHDTAVGIGAHFEKLTFADEPICNFISCESHTGEFFKFIQKHMTFADIDELFDAAMVRGDKLEMVFVTENGSPKERILGAITAYDMVGYVEEE